MSERESGLAGFNVVNVQNGWAEYGIREYTGSFGSIPKMYKVVSVSEGKSTVNHVKSPGFIPVPNRVAMQVTEAVRGDLNLQIKEQANGSKYFAVLTGGRQGEVQVGDYVAWGLQMENNPVGSFRMRTYLLRLKCTNGMTAQEDSEQIAIPKSYDIREMVDHAINMARSKQEQMDEKLEFFRQLKNYRMNLEFGQLLARRFPRPILEPAVHVEIKEHVPIVVGVAQKDLWGVYNDITYNLSHRKTLKLSTRLEWTNELTSMFRRWVNDAGREDA
ncbi:MAG: hypothetical protein JRN26_03000 [Nitrososphaerota archaeon]|jgi:hypothetical protein|nr:hypothetical protein [Nitrososphaerota archaeon]MDG6930065.1 hypothetical protein [Nitrososphaerota archaeon]MDG6931781.1 hypothetical protein [Nitrososphaerota archaeon]MDG6935842.1 hypothetical protein [Nitrososphaerota archaeon]MDG6944609.1 hypothetical protein [Nitrososphaerota archaeon]